MILLRMNLLIVSFPFAIVSVVTDPAFLVYLAVVVVFVVVVVFLNLVVFVVVVVTSLPSFAYVN